MAKGFNALVKHIRMRVDPKAMEKFKKKCMSVHNKQHTDMIRELIDAFNEGRVRIITTEEARKSREELYHD